jgi:hypothetical protein
MSSRRKTLVAVLLWALLCATSVPAAAQKAVESAARSRPGVLWTDPGEIRSKDLFNGPGGEHDRPKLPVRFIKEDKHGQNSKFDVEDANGQKWTAKLGIEAQPEPVASRLLWAVGYFTNENYYAANLEVKDLPEHLSRGQGHVVSPGRLDGARLQRKPDHSKKEGTWNWKRNEFAGTRELNGLRVMMVLISNWDLKDENNEILESHGKQAYLVSDVGTAFGYSGKHWTEAASKNNLKEYQHARFIAKVTPEYVDFNFPRRPPLMHLFALPSYIRQIRMRPVGNHVPRADAKWIGSLLGQLSTTQIEDAFRAGGYSREKAAAFTQVVQARIAELNKL